MPTAPAVRAILLIAAAFLAVLFALGVTATAIHLGWLAVAVLAIALIF